MATRTIPSNTDDVLDSRDIIARIDDLQDNEERDEDEQAELAALLALQEECSGYVDDWQHGAQLVRDSYFVEHAQELAEDIGAIAADAAWPACHIDWDAAADALKADYTSAEFDGVTYWAR